MGSKGFQKEEKPGSLDQVSESLTGNIRSGLYG